MKIIIEEIIFKDCELYDAHMDTEEKIKKYVDEYGREPMKAIKFFTRKKPTEEILVPVFNMSEDGEAISIRQKKEIKSKTPKLHDVLRLVFQSANYYWLEKQDIVYVYICYREDIPDCVGICSYDSPLYKTRSDKQ